MKKALVLSFIALVAAVCPVQRSHSVVKKIIELPKPPPGGGFDPNGSCGHDPNECFGVVGLSCDGIELPSGTFAGCIGDECTINAGSWDHDECCFRSPNGHFCGVQNAANGPACSAQWNVAIHRVTHGLSWRRQINKCVHNTVGRVDFSSYCAFSGWIVASTDRAKGPVAGVVGI